MKETSYCGSLPLNDLTYNGLKENIRNISKEHDLLDHRINVVSARTLKPIESIGNPERKDFPLVKGREVMVEARFGTGAGHAFTDMPGDFEGTVQDVLAMGLENNFERAVFVSSLNAVLRHLGWIERTVHCRNEEPEACARHLVQFVRERFGEPQIAFIGLQPAMVDNLSGNFPIRVSDLDAENVGTSRYGVPIEDVGKTMEILDWGNVIFATGSTFVNNTYRSVVKDKPVIFYGVTVAGIAYLTNCLQYCPLGH